MSSYVPTAPPAYRETHGCNFGSLETRDVAGLRIHRTNRPRLSEGRRAQNAPASTTASTPPTIQINGDNPAIIHVGDTYADLGATITGPQADLNLGIKTFLNGTLVSNIVVDTSQVATDTIDYIATDSAGLTSTSTRIVIIESAPPLDPTGDASTAAATSTAQ
jgi:Domain of unknown function (DUF5011)